MQKLTILISILIFCFLAACKKEPEKVISINPSEFSVADQIKIGKAFRNAIESNSSHFKMLNRETYSAAYSYVSILLKTLVQTAGVEHRNVYEWTVNIIHNDSIRTAFFLPGGYFYVYTGLLKFLDTESQLLGVIGHELYYADTDLLIFKMKEGLGGILLGDILLDKTVPDLGTVSAALPELAFAGKAVLEADSFSVRLLCPFLYEPSGIGHVIEKTNQNSSVLHWLNVRVADAEIRLQQIADLAINCGLPGVQNEANYKKFKQEYLP